MVHTHYGGRFERQDDGSVTRLGANPPPPSHRSDDAAFLRIAKEIVNYSGHIGYELCSPVLIGHRHAGLAYALGQAELACVYMRQILDSV
jgi:hypothetical protein